MPTQFPDANDVFTEPSAPQDTPLSSAGTGTRNHAEHHRDLGDAVEKMQELAVLPDHDHSGTGDRPTAKLAQANTHEDADTDLAAGSIHHTLGTGPNQAARGNHTHDYNGPSITGQPYLKATSGNRPANPTLGTMIYETDTNRVRVWAQFPGDTEPRWVLLPVGQIPVVRLRQGLAQRINSGGSVIEWRTEDEDNFGFFSAAQSMTEIVFGEPGLYSVDTAVQWAQNDIFGDRAMTGLTVNGAETPYKTWEFIRGNNFFAPGFSQSVHLAAKVRLKLGDRLSVVARHNASGGGMWTFSDSSSKTDTRIEITYLGP